MTHWVYLLQNSSGKFYVGQTSDTDARLNSHNRTDKSGGKFTRKNGPWELVWKEEHPSRASAMARERQIKRMKSAQWIRKELLNGRVQTSSKRNLLIAMHVLAFKVVPGYGVPHGKNSRPCY